ncbi:hypothetical protein D3C71_1141220 [compost metagenome]
MISVAKNMGLATSAIFCAIVFSCSRPSGSSSLFLRMVSSITMAPSTIIPKSIAPKESKLAGIWVKCIRIKAINKDNGIVMATKSAPRQLPRKIIRTKITKIIPSRRVLETVCRVLSTKLVLSSTTCIFTSSGRIFSFSSCTVAFTPANTSEGFSFFNSRTIPSILSE